MVTHNVANASELTTALSSAGSGDIINLADGSYGDYTFSSETGIRVLGGLGAVFSRLTIDGCGDCVFHGFSVISKSLAAIDTMLVRIWAVPVSTTTQLINVYIEGADPQDVSGHPVYVSERSDDLMLINHSGIEIGTASASFPERRNDGTVIVAGCWLKYTHKGINSFGSEDVICVGNWFHSVGKDCFSHGGCNDVLFQNNYGCATRYTGSDDQGYWHKDFCQGQAGSGRAIVCRGNFQPMQDNQITSQGLFHDDGSWTYGYAEQNIIMGGNLRGIEMPVEHFSGSWSYENTVFRAKDWGAAATHAINTITRAGNLQGHNTNNDGAFGSDWRMQYDAPTDPNYYDEFYTNILGSGNIFPVDLVPVTGGLADWNEATHFGAAERIREILYGTPFSYRTLPFSFGPSLSDIDSSYVELGNPYEPGWTWPVGATPPPSVSGLILSVVAG